MRGKKKERGAARWDALEIAPPDKIMPGPEPPLPLAAGSEVLDKKDTQGKRPDIGGKAGVEPQMCLLLNTRAQEAFRGVGDWRGREVA